MEKLKISPVSRIEGEGQITIYVDDNGNIERARFQMLEFRGFEEFLKQRPIWEMPLITSKICGICPIPHHLAAVKAAEAALGVSEIPPLAIKLRKLLLDGGSIQDHALHFIYLAFPDFVFDASEVKPEKRSVIGLFKDYPDLVKKGIFLRKFGVTLAEAVGGHSIYPTTAIPGGMSRPIDEQKRTQLLDMLDEALQYAEETAKLAWKATVGLSKKYPANFSSKFMGLSRDGNCAHYDGSIVVIDEAGKVNSRFEADDYEVYIEESVERDSWGKFPFLKKQGVRDGVYRVGPMARLNIAESINGESATKWLAKYKELAGKKPNQHLFSYHLARCIELVSHLEAVGQVLQDQDITGKEVRTPVQRAAGEGVGAVEAPRGTLIHHYRCNDKGVVEYANLIVPTTHNNFALNASLAEVAEEVVKDGKLDDRGTQRMEMAVRAYDPCLSCATHAWTPDKKNGAQIKIVRTSEQEEMR